MATNTPNYNLVKPADNETADIQVINGNMDKTDSELKNVNEKADGKISHSLATAVNDFLVASAAGQFVKKTLAEIKTILGLGSAAYKDAGVAGGVALFDDVETHKADYEYQVPVIVGTQIRLQKQSGTNILKFKLAATLAGGAITISLDGGVTGKPLKDIEGVALVELEKGYVEVINDALNFTLRPKGGGFKGSEKVSLQVATGYTIEKGKAVSFIEESNRIVQYGDIYDKQSALIKLKQTYADLGLGSFYFMKLTESIGIMYYYQYSNGNYYFQAYRINNKGSITLGTSVLTGAKYGFGWSKISDTIMMVIYGNSSPTMKFDITIDPATLALTIGAEQGISGASSSGNDAYLFKLNEEGKYIRFYKGTSMACIVITRAADGKVSVGTEFSIDAQNIYGLSPYQFTDNKFLFNLNGTSNHRTILVSVDATGVISMGGYTLNPLTLNSNGYKFCKINDTTFTVFTSLSSYVAIGKIVGTTITYTTLSIGVPALYRGVTDVYFKDNKLIFADLELSGSKETYGELRLFTIKVNQDATSIIVQKSAINYGGVYPGAFIILPYLDCFVMFRSEIGGWNATTQNAYSTFYASFIDKKLPIGISTKAGASDEYIDVQKF